jgi:hypothetical protein
MSEKKQDHSNEFYLMQFGETYTQESVLNILKTLDVMVRHEDIFGFGIYFKSNKTEFTIVLKLKERTGKNWIQITYLLESKGWVNIIKQANLGPKELYQNMNARGLYTFTSTPPIEYPITDPISRIDSYFSASRDVEYKLSQFNKYGGNNQSQRQNFKKSRKRLHFVRKTSRKRSRNNLF